MSTFFSSEKRRRPVVRTESTRLKTLALENGARSAFSAAVWSRIGLAFVTVLALFSILVVVGRPFRYRLGQVNERGLRLKVPLQIPNDIKTRIEQDKAVANCPLMFQHQPQLLIEQKRRLLTLIESIAKQADYEMFDGILKNEWKLTAAEFATVRTVLCEPTELAAFKENVEKFFEPLVQYGVLDDSEFPNEEEGKPSYIEVRAAGADETLLARIDNVLLSKIVKEGGPLKSRLRDLWSAAGVADTLGRLVLPPRPTLKYDLEATRLAEAKAKVAVKPVFDPYAAGAIVVPANSPINEEQLRLLRVEHDVWQSALSWRRWWLYTLGIFLLVATLVAGVSLYLRVFEGKLVQRFQRLAGISMLSIAAMVLCQIFRTDPYRATVLPIAIVAQLLTIAYGRSLALVVSFGLSVCVSIGDPDPLMYLFILCGGTSLGIISLDAIRSRTKLIFVGFILGLSYGVITFACGLYYELALSVVLLDVARNVACGLIAGFLSSGSLPFIESAFGIVTDISLIELADSSHPLLQELVHRAPGTYNHSVTVSIIGEAAAKSIGANALLVRVGALFHDVGKMLKPHYFVENCPAGQRNRHDQLEPAMSTLIIIGHVKDGMDLARAHHLPEPILDMVCQHHGTTLVDYFYHEATKIMNESGTNDESVEESAFRYPGPKPQSKEAAVLMLSDCVESASRALSEPTAARIDKLVHTLALNRLLDGQFNESGLTLKEMQTIEDSLKKSLTSVYHGRIKYPAAS